jgi:hypothetical protein
MFWDYFKKSYPLAEPTAQAALKPDRKRLCLESQEETLTASKSHIQPIL